MYAFDWVHRLCLYPVFNHNHNYKHNKYIYKHMRLKNRVNFRRIFSKICKCKHLITGVNGTCLKMLKSIVNNVVGVMLLSQQCQYMPHEKYSNWQTLRDGGSECTWSSCFIQQQSLHLSCMRLFYKMGRGNTHAWSNSSKNCFSYY